MFHIKQTLIIILFIIYMYAFASSVFLKAPQFFFSLKGRTINNVLKKITLFSSFIGNVDVTS